MVNGIHKFCWMVSQELSHEFFFQSIFYVLQSYGLFVVFLLFTASQLFVPETLLDSAPSFYGFLLFGVSLLFVTLDQQSQFLDDWRDGYLNWLKVHGQNLRSYFFVKVLTKFIIQLFPLLGLTLLFFMVMSISFSYIIYFLCLSLSLGIVICWGSLLAALLGVSDHKGEGETSTYFMGFLLLPLLIPTILVGIECMKALVMGQFCGYYLGMQLGLFVVTLSLSLALAPFVLNQVE